jgi:hypothetical protein
MNLPKPQRGPSDLGRHFQNYFELLLGCERAKLQRIIEVECSDEAHALLPEIDCRIAHLRGAVRMAKLLCLIDSSEAKLKYDQLTSEHERLIASCRAFGKPDSPSESDTLAQRERMRNLVASLSPHPA